MPKTEKKRKTPRQKKPKLEQSPAKRETLRIMCKWIDRHDFQELSEEHKTLFMQAFKTYETGSDADRQKKFFSEYGSLWSMKTAKECRLDFDQQTIEFRKREEELVDVWKHMAPMDEGQWSTLCGFSRATVKKEGKMVDPLLHDILLLEIWDKYIDEDTRKSIIWKDESGDFFIFDIYSKIWNERDAKNAPAWLFTQMAKKGLELVKDQEILFSTKAKQKLYEVWIQKLATYGALANLLKMRCRFPNPIVQELNTKPWVIPLLMAKNYDAEAMQLVERKKEDLFSAEASFDYLSVENTINTRAQRLELRALMQDEKILQSGHPLVKHLHKMFPNAMQLIAMSFNDSDRLWFMLLRFGMMMSNTCAREILFLFGKGKGGKSTLMFRILTALGDLATPMSKQSFVKAKVESNGSAHTTDLCKAAYRRLVLVDELESSDSMKEALLKNWASHQPIAIREIFRKQSTQVMKAFLIFLTNSPPRFSMDEQVIMERVRAAKVTTKFFSEVSRDTERPRNFKKETWQDQYSEDEDIYWVLQTQEKKEFLAKFETNYLFRQELGTLLCTLSSITYWYLECFGELPLPAIIVKDSDEFFKAADILEMFMQECCVAAMAYDDAIEFMDLLFSFNSFAYKFGQKAFHPGNFKKILHAKNLLFTRRGKNTLRVKLKLKSTVEVKTNNCK